MDFIGNLHESGFKLTFMHGTMSILFISFYKGTLVETETIGRVFLIGINRPDKRNAVNQETAAQLYEAIETFEKTEDLYAAVLYGKGL